MRVMVAVGRRVLILFSGIERRSTRLVLPTVFLIPCLMISFQGSVEATDKSIIFIRDHSACGQEISGYIDYAHRLKCGDFEPYFTGKKRLLPQPTDLSFYNWKTNEVSSSDSENYQVIANHPTGVLFMNKKDRNIVNVDPQAPPCEHSPRISVKSDIYHHVVIFDHYIKCTV